MSIEKYLPWLAAGGIALMVLKPKKTTSTTYTGGGSVVSNTNAPRVDGAPALPSIYNEAYYKQYIYPALVAKNPQLQNSQYRLTEQDAINYKNNYQELREWLPSQVPGFHKTERDALQFHWTSYAVPAMYSFVPFYPTKREAWINTEPTPTKGKGWLSDVWNVASTVIGVILGPGQMLNDFEQELLFTGGYVVDSVLPMYFNSANGETARVALQKFDSLVEQYA